MAQQGNGVWPFLLGVFIGAGSLGLAIELAPEFMLQASALCRRQAEGTLSREATGPAALSARSTKQRQRIDIFWISEDIVLKSPDAARRRWEGQPVEVKFWPVRYEQAGRKYRFWDQDNPTYCDLNEADFERIRLRRSGPFIVVRGRLGSIKLDQPIALQNCELVSLDASGWQAGPRDSAP